MKKRVTRKLIIVLSFLVWILLMVGCGTLSAIKGPQINYGNSSIYSQNDMDLAISLIENKFPTKRVGKSANFIA